MSAETTPNSLWVAIKKSKELQSKFTIWKRTKSNKASFAIRMMSMESATSKKIIPLFSSPPQMMVPPKFGTPESSKIMNLLVSFTVTSPA